MDDLPDGDSASQRLSGSAPSGPPSVFVAPELNFAAFPTLS